MGYPFYLGMLYYAIGDSVLPPRIIKAFLGAYTCVLAYKIGRNNFGEAVGRLAGIMTMLVPNMIYYCGLHVKETEMVFLSICFTYLADKVIRANKARLWDIFLLILTVTLLFFFRTVLAGCLLGSVAITIVFSSSRISTMNKRVLLVLLLAIGTYVIALTPLADNITEHLEAGTSNLTSQMNSYATRGDGNNKFARYGSRSVFLPLMIMAPFPTFVDTLQPNAMMMAGAYFTRNVYAFFVIISLWTLYKRKQVRNHLLLLSSNFSYIFVLASSGFALSERFHLPLLPYLLIFAAHGISQMNAKTRKLYLPYLFFTLAVVIGWNWFKLAGRS
ncbi:glycosyltransferase family 39 protein [Spirosoma sp. BT702]|uniref:Glycosyltransferase family 39 protein n=2 Tax=Spirosoma profusum TaxID=2771354 RepID=A0A927AS48_9BACT|nr:glycosyltransferase family 39 protein [Spirosoma profusum]MBD2700695.1 glycosyltransferase family 39 protein [Spirosoma profusum]